MALRLGIMQGWFRYCSRRQKQEKGFGACSVMRASTAPRQTLPGEPFTLFNWSFRFWLDFTGVSLFYGRGFKLWLFPF